MREKGCVPKGRPANVPWRMYYYLNGDLVASGTATEIAKMVGKATSTVRAYAADRKPFRNGMYFEYEPEYYIHKQEEYLLMEESKTVIIPSRSLADMAGEAKIRGVSYGRVQAEEWQKKQKKIVVPKGYTSMRDRGR